MKILIILAIVFGYSVASASGKCKYACEPIIVNKVTEVTEVNNLHIDSSALKEAIAQSATLETLMPTAAGKTRFNVLGANYDGQQALGVTLVHRFQQGRTLEAGCAHGDNMLCRLGGGFEF